MNELRQAAQQALKYMKSVGQADMYPEEWAIVGRLEAALAQQAVPVQEPYCYVYEYDGVFGMHREFYPKTYNGQKPSRTVPVYTAQPQRKPLTEEEIDALPWNGSPRQFARAVERAHGIGEEK